MSTDVCKQLIENISVENGFNKKSKWKRIKKYKEGSLILRDFQNSENDIIVISEDNNGSYSLFEIKRNVKLSEEISKEEEFTSFMYVKKRLPIKRIVLRFAVTEKVIKRSKKFIISVVIIFDKNLSALKNWIRK